MIILTLSEWAINALLWLVVVNALVFTYENVKTRLKQKGESNG